MRGKEVEISEGTFDKFIKGEQKAIENVYLKFKNLMYFVIASYVSSRYDAEDILSDAFIKAVEHRHELKDYTKLRPYLASIAKNQALDYLRKQREIPSSDIIDEMYGEEDKTNALLSIQFSHSIPKPALVEFENKNQEEIFLCQMRAKNLP